MLSGETSTSYSGTADGINNTPAATGDSLELDIGAWSALPELVNTRSGQLFSGVNSTQPGALHKPLYFNGMELAKVWSNNQLTSTTLGDAFIRATEGNDSINLGTTSTTFSATIGSYTSLSFTLDSGKRVLLQSGNGNDTITTGNATFPNSMEVDGGAAMIPSL